MTEQKQYTREQLMSKKTFWKRFSSGSLFAGVGLAVGSLFLTIPYLTPKKPEEFTQYVNAQQTYNYLQRQKDEVKSPNLPYWQECGTNGAKTCAERRDHVFRESDSGGARGVPSE